MQRVRGSNYISNLDTISEFIAKDSINRALNFLDKPDDQIDCIPRMPYKYRKSLYYRNAILCSKRTKLSF